MWQLTGEEKLMVLVAELVQVPPVLGAVTTTGVPVEEERLQPPLTVQFTPWLLLPVMLA
jgi:hypothetical protein